MNESASGRRVVVAATVMFLAGQVLAITNDVILRQNDPADLVLLGVLVVLSFFMLRRARWARWTMVALNAAGGLLYLAAFALLVASTAAPGFWPAAEAAVPALKGLHAMVVAFAAAPEAVFLSGSVLVSALLALIAVAMLSFAPSVRAYFSREAPAPKS